MSLLSWEELQALRYRGVIRGVDEEHVNAASIDITLGRKILVEDKSGFNPHVISLRNRDPMKLVEFNCALSPFILQPGQFILAQSKQSFYLPNDISAEYKLKSSMARIGLNHALAGWCDAGWYGSVLTLELMNVSEHHAIELQAGDRIGQMIFFHHRKVPDDRSYAARGRYNNDTETQEIKVDPTKGTTYDIDD